MFCLDDTIAAIATAPGAAARGIVRLSGQNSLEIARCFFHADDAAFEPTMVTVPTAADGHLSGDMPPADAGSSHPVRLPATLFLWPTNRSYTRQPMAELHTFGSPPLVDWLLRTLCAAGARLAQPGEFTLRAFLAGRIDLTQAEAVLGVVDAADRRQLDTALRQLAGGLSKPLGRLRDDLLNLLADLEAGLDFVEEDIRFVQPQELEERLTDAAEQLDALAGQLSQRSAGHPSARAVLVGWPNVGKSSLFNALLDNAAAIVSPQAGTTRDYLAAKWNCNGVEIELIDTAGIGCKALPTAIDTAAQAAAAEQHQQAELGLLCLDATRLMNDWERQQLTGENTLIVLTKCDLAACDWTGQNEPIHPYTAVRLAKDMRTLATSSRTGQGLDELRSAVYYALSDRPGESHVVTATAVRARESIRRAADSLARARHLTTADAGEELIAAEVRTSLEELSQVVGAIYTDDLLDRIFSRFCIGK